MALGNVTVTTAANFIPEMWSSAILNYAERKFRLRDQVRDVSALLPAGLSKGDIIHVPRVTEETAVIKQANTAVVFDTNTDGKTDVTINQYYHKAKRIEDIAKIQANADLFNIYVQTMGYALAKQVELYVSQTLIQTATANDIGLTTDNQITAAEFRTGAQKLMDIGVDPSAVDAFWYGSPALYLYLMGLDEASSWEKIGPAKPSAHVTGVTGQVYGVPTFQSSDWASAGSTGEEAGSLFTRDAILLAIQLEPRVQAQYDINFLATSVVADVLYGGSLTQTVGTAAGQIANFTSP